MMRRVFVRVDGGWDIGLGHVFRCLAFADMIRHLHIIKFVVLKCIPSVKALIENEGFELHNMPSCDDLLSIVDRDDIVVLDGYKFDAAYQLGIKKRGCVLVCIDDLHDEHFFADLVINHAPGVLPAHYDAEDYTAFLLGPRYALLRSSFLNQAMIKRVAKEKVENILINFGGSDNRDLTRSTLPVVLRYEQVAGVTLVTGSSYQRVNELESYIRPFGDRVMHLHALSEHDMLDAMLHADLAILPASGVLFECLACRTPCISGYYVDNQISIYTGFKRMGVFFDAENFDERSISKALDQAFTANRSEQMMRQEKCIDGRSPERIVAELQLALKE